MLIKMILSQAIIKVFLDNIFLSLTLDATVQVALLDLGMVAYLTPHLQEKIFQ